MDIRTTTPNHVKTFMRKQKKVPACIKAEVYKGARNPAVTMQFNQDVAVYGLYEAMLYVQSYEDSGDYAEGTAHAAMDAYFNTPAVSKLLNAALAN